jgi:hypothetical protein
VKWKIDKIVKFMKLEIDKRANSCNKNDEATNLWNSKMSKWQLDDIENCCETNIDENINW